MSQGRKKARPPPSLPILDPRVSSFRTQSLLLGPNRTYLGSSRPLPQIQGSIPSIFHSPSPMPGGNRGFLLLIRSGGRRKVFQHPARYRHTAEVQE